MGTPIILESYLTVSTRAACMHTHHLVLPFLGVHLTEMCTNVSQRHVQEYSSFGFVWWYNG